MGRHLSTITVRFAELDPYAHVNHAVYATYCEVARTEALIDAELPLNELAAEGFQFIVTDLSMRFRRPAVAGDVLTVETWLSEIGRATSHWSQCIRRGDEELVTAELRIGVCNERGRPTRAPAWLLEKLQVLAEEVP